MGSSNSTIENNCIEEIKKIDIDNLDLSNIDKLQLKAIKELGEKVKDIENKKSDKIFLRLPINLCSYSIF